MKRLLYSQTVSVREEYVRTVEHLKEVTATLRVRNVWIPSSCT